MQSLVSFYIVVIQGWRVWIFIFIRLNKMYSLSFFFSSENFVLKELQKLDRVSNFAIIAFILIPKVLYNSRIFQHEFLSKIIGRLCKDYLPFFHDPRVYTMSILRPDNLCQSQSRMLITNIGKFYRLNFVELHQCQFLLK